MKIECLCRRPGGSVVNIDNVNYHFKPTPDGSKEVCEVENPKHAARFLSIKEGYRAVEDIPQDIAKMVIEGAPVLNAGIPDPVDDFIDDDLQDEDINKMSDEEVLIFAKEEMGIENPEDKDELAEYAEELLAIKIEKKKKPVNIIRDIVNESKSRNG